MVLRVLYSATTNRMLRVSVNGFFESVGVVIQSMEELDLDVVDRPVTQSLDGVQGLDVPPTKA
jgi:EKC/KEOPS complex subunit PCC1/LAGE3